MRPFLASFALYGLLTVLITFPLVFSIGSAVPHDLGDPLLVTWILWWNSQAVPFTAAWWNAPSFYPMPGSFALSEHLLGLAVISAPLQWLTGNPLVGYNVLFLLSFVLSAAACHLLVFSLTRRHDVSVIAGLVYGFNPYRMAQLSHLQVISSYWMPIGLLALHQYIRSRRMAWLALFGIAWLLQSASNGYYLFFYSVLVILWLAWFTPKTMTDARDVLVRVGLVWLVAALPLVPLLLKYREVHERLALGRQIAEIELFSADVSAIFDPAPLLRFWPSAAERPPEQELFPGLTAPLIIVAAAWLLRRRAWRVPAATWALVGIAGILAAVGAAALVRGPWSFDLAGAHVSVGAAHKPFSLALVFLSAGIIFLPVVRDAIRAQSTAGFYATAALVMWLFSFGPTARLWGTPVLYKPPYAWLVTMPGFEELRVPARFGMLAVLCLATAAALALDGLRQRVRASVFSGILIAGIMGALLDGWIERLPLLPPPKGFEVPANIAAVFEIPTGDPFPDTAALFRSIGHGKPTVNGYGSYLPPHIIVLGVALEADEPGILDPLRPYGPLYLAVDPRFARAAALTGTRPLAHDAEREFSILPGAAATPLKEDAIAGTEVPIAAVRGTGAGSSTLAHLTDGNLRTAWSSAGAQHGGEELLVELRGAEVVTGVDLLLGPHYGGYPAELAVSIQGEDETWTDVWHGRTAVLAIRAALSEPRDVPVKVRIPATRTRALRLRQVGSAKYPWMMAELRVRGG